MGCQSPIKRYGQRVKRNTNSPIFTAMSMTLAIYMKHEKRQIAFTVREVDYSKRKMPRFRTTKKEISFRRSKKNGNTWAYEYYDNGMMSKVIKPDQTEFTYKYDSLGRWIEKRSDEKNMQFVWDGNTILHEYCSHDDSVGLENDNLVTRVFSNGFVPLAKITSEGNYSIISDYLGTPVEAYDEQGNQVWSAELDIYGRVKECIGEENFIPFRYQGQYEDVEIGLYYN